MPEIIGVTAENCGGDGDASWRSFQRDIQFCYEFAESARKIFDEADEHGKKPSTAEVDDSVAGFTNGIILHELGHALIDLYALPALGKEEDAVDQLSVLLLATSDDRHAGYAIDTINAWGGFAAADEAKGNTTERLGSYAEEHSLNGQRFYNWTCWLYGSDPKAYAAVVQTDEHPDGVLPESRAGGCDTEFERIEKSWKTLLKPYLK